MAETLTLELPPLHLVIASDGRDLGGRVLDGLLAMATQGVRHLQERASKGGARRVAAVSRLRGTGRGIRFRDLVAALEREHPITLESPFEGSMKVAGAAWNSRSGALAKLRWSEHADDLPMHVHEHSDRFIIVDQGRGFFHVTDETADDFTGTKVRTIPARERDVFMFSRGVVHTFSTAEEPMTLLSCQLPFLAFDDPRQYRLPKVRWIARERPDTYPVTVACDPGWMIAAFGEYGAV